MKLRGPLSARSGQSSPPEHDPWCLRGDGGRLEYCWTKLHSDWFECRHRNGLGKEPFLSDDIRNVDEPREAFALQMNTQSIWGRRVVLLWNIHVCCQGSRDNRALCST